MPWTVNSELYPLWCRSTCFAIATSFNWLFNFLVAMTFLSLTKALTQQGESRALAELLFQLTPVMKISLEISLKRIES